jgi:hypothetical protein
LARNTSPKSDDIYFEKRHDGYFGIRREITKKDP